MTHCGSTGAVRPFFTHTDFTKNQSLKQSEQVLSKVVIHYRAFPASSHCHNEPLLTANQNASYYHTVIARALCRNCPASLPGSLLASINLQTAMQGLEVVAIWLIYAILRNSLWELVLTYVCTSPRKIKTMTSVNSV